MSSKLLEEYIVYDTEIKCFQSYLSSSARTTVKVESSASNLKTARVCPDDPTSPDTTHLAKPSSKSYDGETETPLPRKTPILLLMNDGVGMRNDPFMYSTDDNIELLFSLE